MSEEKKSHGCMIAGIGCLAVIAIVVVAIVAVAVFVPDEETSAPVVSMDETPVVDLAAEVNRGQELISWLRVKNNQTELQNDAALGKFTGKTIIVKGKIREIGKTTFGDEVYVSLTVAQMDILERANIQFNIAEPMVQEVGKWTKGTSMILRGRVKGYGDQIEDDVICINTESVPEEKYTNLIGK